MDVDVEFGVTADDIAGRWQELQEITKGNKLVLNLPGEEFWVLVGEPSTETIVSPDVKWVHCESEDTIQPIFFGPGILYIGGSIERSPLLEPDPRIHIAKSIGNLFDNVHRAKFKLFTDEGQVFTIQPKLVDDRLFFQAFLCLNVPNYVEVIPDSCYEEQPAGIGAELLTVEEKLKNLPLWSRIENNQISRGGNTNTVTYEVPLVDSQSPRYVYGPYTDKLRIEYDYDNDIATCTVTATSKFHNWLKNRPDVTQI